MGIRSVWGKRTGHQEIVVRARPTTTFPPPFPIRALGPAIILFMTVIGMSQLGPVVQSSLHHDSVNMSMPPPTTISFLFGIPSALTGADEPTRADAPSKVITAATDVREQVAPAAAVVSAVSHTSPVGGMTHPVASVVSTVLRPSRAAAVTGPEATVVSAALHTSPSLAGAKPAQQRAHGKSKHATKHAKGTTTLARDRAVVARTRASADDDGNHDAIRSS